RDDLVTGVQTCALPIWISDYAALAGGRTRGRPRDAAPSRLYGHLSGSRGRGAVAHAMAGRRRGGAARGGGDRPLFAGGALHTCRSEERRVGEWAGCGCT